MFSFYLSTSWNKSNQRPCSKSSVILDINLKSLRQGFVTLLKNLVKTLNSIYFAFQSMEKIPVKPYTVKIQKFGHSKFCINDPKIWTTRLYHTAMLLKDADGIANSVDPDQTAPLGAVWSGSALFAQAYLSKNLGSLRYWDFTATWD